MLYTNITSAFEKLTIIQVVKEQEKWVYNLSLPCYHTVSTCPALTSDFINILVPESLNKDRVEEYRNYFIENVEKYGFSENKRDPRIFCRLLIEKFSLRESLDEMVEQHFKAQNISNTGTEDFTASFDFEKDKVEIDQLIQDFMELTKDIDPAISRRSFLARNKQSIEKANLSSDEVEQMQKLYSKKREILSRILTFHFHSLAVKGLDISEPVLKMVGLKQCKYCEKHRNNLISNKDIL